MLKDLEGSRRTAGVLDVACRLLDASGGQGELSTHQMTHPPLLAAADALHLERLIPDERVLALHQVLHCAREWTSIEWGGWGGMG